MHVAAASGRPQPCNPIASTRNKSCSRQQNWPESAGMASAHRLASTHSTEDSSASTPDGMIHQMSCPLVHSLYSLAVQRGWWSPLLPVSFKLQVVLKRWLLVLWLLIWAGVPLRRCVLLLLSAWCACIRDNALPGSRCDHAVIHQPLAQRCRGVCC